MAESEAAPEGGGDDQRTKLIVNYLPQSMRDDELRALFADIGPVESAQVAVDKQTDYSYGYGFVEYENATDAAKAVGEITGMHVQNKTLKVSYSRPKSANSREANLYVCNLGQHITDEKLCEMFSPYGTIITQKILVNNQTGQPRGVAFVRFSRKEEAEAAIANVSGAHCQGSRHPVEVRVADDHGKQKASFFATCTAGNRGRGRGGQGCNADQGLGGYGGGHYYGGYGYDAYGDTWQATPNHGAWGGHASRGRGRANRFDPTGRSRGGRRGGRGGRGQHFQPPPWGGYGQQPWNQYQDDQYGGNNFYHDVSSHSQGSSEDSPWLATT